MQDPNIIDGPDFIQN